MPQRVCALRLLNSHRQAGINSLIDQAFPLIKIGARINTNESSPPDQRRFYFSKQRRILPDLLCDQSMHFQTTTIQLLMGSHGTEIGDGER